jgi:site-specific recombinase XerD
MKDKAYQQTPLGVMVRSYVRYLRNEYGATDATIRDYEAILARMSLTLADREVIDVSTEDLRDVIDLWASRSGRTRQKVTSVIRSFWTWMEDNGHIALSPAARIRRPKAAKRVARVLPADSRERLLAAAKIPRDRLGLYCLLGLGLRREELAGVQVRDFDAQRGWLRVYGKGQKERELPLSATMLEELRLYLAADLPALGRPPEPDDFLLYPTDRRANGKGSEGQMTYHYIARPKDQPSAPSVHRWWYRIARSAGLVGHGSTSGLNMHQARHLFAVDMRRAAGIDAASQALGHSDLSTTLGIYGHRDADDLKTAMDALERWRAEQDEEA